MTQETPSRSGHVVIGVDTHKHIHVAAVMDTIGGILATLTIATDTAGFKQLLAWAESFGKVISFGIEGTGSYGAGLTSFLRRQGHKVVEVSRPDRRLRRLNGKSDTLDAENAARAVLAGFATATPKTMDGAVEMIRQLKVAHDTAVKQKAATMVTLKAMLVHAPEQLRIETARKTPAYARALLCGIPTARSRISRGREPACLAVACEALAPARRGKQGTYEHDRGTRPPACAPSARRVRHWRGHCRRNPHRGRRQPRAHQVRGGVRETRWH